MILNQTDAGITTMQLTTDQINSIHAWWCHQLHLNNYQEANGNPLFRLQLDLFSWHLYELLCINRYFLELNIKIRHGISLIVAEHDFQPTQSALAEIFNLAIEKSALPFSAFNTGTQMTITEDGKISVKIILSSKPKRYYDAEKILFWDSNTNRNLPTQQLSTREICLDSEKNIDTEMQQLLKTFDSYANENIIARK